MRVGSNVVEVLRDEIVPLDVEAALYERENGRCCASGWDKDLRGTFVVPPSIVNDEDLQPGVCVTFSPCVEIIWHTKPNREHYDMSLRLSYPSTMRIGYFYI